MVDFLVARLTEDLALMWERDSPGMAAQFAVLDELLTALLAGALPHRRELRMLLFGYGRHPDYEPGWTVSLAERP